MKRKVVQIDRDKCIGCGACAGTCHQGVIEMVDGKATVMREDACDGLERCLPGCPVDAISFIEKEVAVNVKEPAESHNVPMSGCPGSMSRQISRANEEKNRENPVSENAHSCSPSFSTVQDMSSKLNQWPVQIKLVPVNAPYFNDANLLIAADCTAFAYGDFHNKFIKNKVCLIGCPKLDEGNYADKLTDIIENNNIKSVTIVRMEVPCCGGLENAAKTALQASGKFMPWQVVTISIDGSIVE